LPKGRTTSHFKFDVRRVKFAVSVRPKHAIFEVKSDTRMDIAFIHPDLGIGSFHLGLVNVQVEPRDL
jgi:hypothetical protein